MREIPESQMGALVRRGRARRSEDASFGGGKGRKGGWGIPLSRMEMVLRFPNVPGFATT